MNKLEKEYQEIGEMMWVLYSAKKTKAVSKQDIKDFELIIRNRFRKLLIHE